MTMAVTSPSSKFRSRYGKHIQFLHEILFVFNPNFSQKAIPFAIGLFCTLLTVYSGVYERTVLAVLNPSVPLLERVFMDTEDSSFKISETISNIPQIFYKNSETLLSIYGEGVQNHYINLGERVISGSATFKKQANAFFENPPVYLLSHAEELTLREKEFIDASFHKIGNLSLSKKITYVPKEVTAAVYVPLLEGTSLFIDSASVGLFKTINSGVEAVMKKPSESEEALLVEPMEVTLLEEKKEEPSSKGVTLYDEITKKPYCLKLVKGKVESFPGKCS